MNGSVGVTDGNGFISRIRFAAGWKLTEADLAAIDGIVAPAGAAH